MLVSIAEVIKLTGNQDGRNSVAIRSHVGCLVWDTILRAATIRQCSGICWQLQFLCNESVMHHPKDDDPQLANVKAVLQRLQRVSIGADQDEPDIDSRRDETSAKPEASSTALSLSQTGGGSADRSADPDQLLAEPSPERPIDPSTSVPKRRRGVISTMVLAILAASVAAGWWLTQTPGMNELPERTAAIPAANSGEGERSASSDAMRLPAAEDSATPEKPSPQPQSPRQEKKQELEPVARKQTFEKSARESSSVPSPAVAPVPAEAPPPAKIPAPAVAPRETIAPSRPAPRAAASLEGALSETANDMAEGRIKAARARLLSLADRGSVDVAWALGRSYDPNVLRAIPQADAGPDIDTAIRWYRQWHSLSVAQGLVADSISIDRLIQSLR